VLHASSQADRTALLSLATESAAATPIGTAKYVAPEMLGGSQVKDKQQNKNKYLRSINAHASLTHLAGDAVRRLQVGHLVVRRLPLLHDGVPLPLH
jgi:hypothetical protein